MRRVILLAIALCAGLPVVAGCAEETTAGGEPVTVTQVETRTVAPPADTRPEPSSPSATPGPRPDPATGGGGIRVPDVVGRDHQYAQDTMQAAGLFDLAEEDATGQGRLLLWDRNWVVVSQSPPAGALVDADTTIILRSKKDGE